MLGTLHLLIASWLEDHALGEVYFAPFDVVFSRFDVVEPDLIYISNTRAREVLTPANVQGAPDLVVEVGSPGTRRRDKTIKKRLYARDGVTEYWIVETDRDAIIVHRPGPGGLGRLVELSAAAHDVLVTPLLPGLELPLARIFRT